jgi:hypothetical protein
MLLLLSDLVSEFAEYLIKFVVLGLIAWAGVMCGAKYKKNKLAQAAGGQETTSEETVE